MNTNKIFLDQQRFTGDKEIDPLIENAFRSGKQNSIYTLLKMKGTEIRAQEETDLTKFLLSWRPMPSWYDDTRLLKGQVVFKKYAQEMMTLLGVMSLPYCYAASPGNKALYLSEKMRQSTGKRLIETAAFVINVLTPGSLATENDGHVHINKTRLIHAISRYHFKASWNDEWGVPINQEDMAGTNLAFSYIILVGMQQSGYRISHEEKDDFLFTWRYIGYQLNIDEKLLPASFGEAQVLTQLIKERNFRKTKEGVALTTELMNYFKEILPKHQADVIEAQIRYYLGKEIASYIGLKSEPVKDRIISGINKIIFIKNRLATPSNSYQKMMADHVRLRKKFIG
jgi:hypothetical protein